MIGLNRDARHRYSWNGGPWYPGITTVIKTLDKSDVLSGWAKKETARAAVRNLARLTDHMSHTVADPECVVCSNQYDRSPAERAEAWLKSIPGYQKDTAADIGTRVHSMAEAIAGGDSPDISADILPYVDSYRRGFLDAYRPTFDPAYTEFMVYSTEHRYGGTMDVACIIDGEWWLIDYKTAGDKPIVPGPKGFPYPETGLQLSGGAFAEFVGRPGDATQYPLPPVTRFGVVAITRAETRLIPYRVTERTFEVFRACRRLYTFVQEESKDMKEAA